MRQESMQGWAFAAKFIRNRGSFGSLDPLSEKQYSRLDDCCLLPRVPMQDRCKARASRLLSEAKEYSEEQLKKDEPDQYYIFLARKKALKAAKTDRYNTEALLLAAKLSVILGDRETDQESKEKEYEIANKCLVIAPISLGNDGKKDPLKMVEILRFSHDLSMKRGLLARAESELWNAFFHIIGGIVKGKGSMDANGNICVEFHYVPESITHKGQQEKLLAYLPEIRRCLKKIFALDKAFSPQEAIQNIPKNSNGDNQRNEEICIQHSKAIHETRLESREYFPGIALKEASEASSRDPKNPLLEVLLGEISLFANKPEEAFFHYLGASMLLSKANGKNASQDITNSPYAKLLLACVLESDKAIAGSREPGRNAEQICRGFAKYASGELFEARVTFGEVLAAVPKSTLANRWLNEFRHIGGDINAHHVLNSKKSAYI